jgi:hypothetical protein
MEASMLRVLTASIFTAALFAFPANAAQIELGHQNQKFHADVITVNRNPGHRIQIP